MAIWHSLHHICENRIYFHGVVLTHTNSEITQKPFSGQNFCSIDFSHLNQVITKLTHQYWLILCGYNNTLLNWLDWCYRDYPNIQTNLFTFFSDFSFNLFVSFLNIELSLKEHANKYQKVCGYNQKKCTLLVDWRWVIHWRWRA